jgi:hypothetical protein
MTQVAPRRSTNSELNSGPAIAPALPPAAMKPNSRRAASERQASTMTLQNTDTMKRFSDVTATKYAAASARLPGDSAMPIASARNSATTVA